MQNTCWGSRFSRITSCDGKDQPSAVSCSKLNWGTQPCPLSLNPGRVLQFAKQKHKLKIYHKKAWVKHLRKVNHKSYTLMCGAHRKTLMGRKPANGNIKDHLLSFGSLESRTHIDLSVVFSIQCSSPRVYANQANHDSFERFWKTTLYL